MLAKFLTRGHRYFTAVSAQAATIECIALMAVMYRTCGSISCDNMPAGWSVWRPGALQSTDRLSQCAALWRASKRRVFWQQLAMPQPGRQIASRVGDGHRAYGVMTSLCCCCKWRQDASRHGLATRRKHHYDD